MRELITIAMIALVAAACGGTGTVVKEEAKPIPVVTPDKEVSPERQAFVDCYEALACRANLDYDPMDDYATIHEPVEQLKMMVENGDNRLKYYLPVLKRYGYETAPAFLAKDEWFKEAVPLWWEKQRARLLDLMTECKKK